MCDPATLLIIASTAVKAGGSIIGGRMSSKAARAQAELARINADIAAKTGLGRENTLRKQIGRVVGAQTAAFGARNIDPGFGSPLALAAFTEGQGETDARLIRADTQSAIASALGDAAAFEQKAKEARFAGWMGAATAILSGGQAAWPGLPGSAGGSTGTAPKVSGIPTWGGRH